MKNIILSTILIAFLVFTSKADDKKNDNYGFKTIADIPVTPVKNQYKSGTCWSFATTSFLEAEILRMTKKTVDLSEMYFIYYAFISKAENYVRLHGLANFGPGGQAHDVLDVVRNYGFINENEFSGLNYGTEKHEHGELDKVLSNYLKAIISNENGHLTPVWPLTFVSILNSYFIEPPKNTASGQRCKDYANELKINPDNYIELTSYMHHPFYTAFRLEIPDNWSYNSNYYNLPIDELMDIMVKAIKNGYTVCWDGDVSDRGFSHKDGVAVLPETNIENLHGSEMSRWQSLTKEDLKKNAYSFDGPCPERNSSQKDRQTAFDNYSTTDDHLMHLTGLLEDKNGTIYFKTKNSWGTENIFGGYLNMSTSFIRLNTVAIMVHKDAIPKEIRKKLGI